jgi:hypothetical protein
MGPLRPHEQNTYPARLEQTSRLPERFDEALDLEEPFAFSGGLVFARQILHHARPQLLGAGVSAKSLFLLLRLQSPELLGAELLRPCRSGTLSLPCFFGKERSGVLAFWGAVAVRPAASPPPVVDDCPRST